MLKLSTLKIRLLDRSLIKSNIIINSTVKLKEVFTILVELHLIFLTKFRVFSHPINITNNKTIINDIKKNIETFAVVINFITPLDIMYVHYIHGSNIGLKLCIAVFIKSWVLMDNCRSVFTCIEAWLYYPSYLYQPYLLALRYKLLKHSVTRLVLF